MRRQRFRLLQTPVLLLVVLPLLAPGRVWSASSQPRSLGQVALTPAEVSNSLDTPFFQVQAGALPYPYGLAKGGSAHAFERYMEAQTYQTALTQGDVGTYTGFTAVISDVVGFSRMQDTRSAFNTTLRTGRFLSSAQPTMVIDRKFENDYKKRGVKAVTIDRHVDHGQLRDYVTTVALWRKKVIAGITVQSLGDRSAQTAASALAVRLLHRL